MRVVIEVLNGPQQGMKMRLETGQAMQLGRTEWADYAFPTDRHMSSVHCSISADSAGCQIEDQKSSNGTQVNGRKILAKTPLHDGDKLQIGQTLFAVRIHGETAGAPGAAPADAARKPGAAPPPVFAIPAALPSSVRFTVEKCSNGLQLCRGNAAEIEPSDLAARLSHWCPIYLVADFQKLETPRPEELTARHYLFDWFEPVAADKCSPLVISQDELLAWPTLIQEGWGKDGLVCFFSRVHKPVLLEQLRRACRAKGSRTGPPDAIIGCCWPSVLAPLLLHYKPEFARELLAGVDAVLLELPDLPDTWQLFSVGDVSPTLRQLGFQEETAVAAKS